MATRLYGTLPERVPDIGSWNSSYRFWLGCVYFHSLESPVHMHSLKSSRNHEYESKHVTSGCLGSITEANRKREGMVDNCGLH